MAGPVLASEEAAWRWAVQEWASARTAWLSEVPAWRWAVQPSASAMAVPRLYRPGGRARSRQPAAVASAMRQAVAVRAVPAKDRGEPVRLSRLAVALRL